MQATKPPYPAQFRQQMVELVRAGQSESEPSREFCPHVASILSWVSKAQAGGLVGTATAASRDVPLSAAERKDLMELRRKLRQVQMERGILARGYGLVCQQQGEQTYTTSTR